MVKNALINANFNALINGTVTFIIKNHFLAGQDEVITVTLPNDATGEITFIVDGTTYKKHNNGIAAIAFLI